MNITVLCVGTIKEKFYKDAILEYSKRLSRYCKLKIIEVSDEKNQEGATEHEIEMIKEREGERIFKYIKDTDYCITLEIEGKSLDSIQLSKHINQLGISGKSNIVFIIGGSLGLDSRIKKRSDFALSFSACTFPHQLMRVILLEQIYRSFRIIHHEPYHK